MSLSSKLAPAVGGAASLRIARAMAGNGPPRSPEFRRIEALPRRVLDLSSVTDVSDLFVRPGSTCDFPHCPILAEGGRLRPIQSAMLIEASQVSGLFADVGVGWGKTLTALLLPRALCSARAVLLVPPQMRAQLRAVDVPHLSKHFQIPEVRFLDLVTLQEAGPPSGEVWAVAYSQISDETFADVLTRLKPDLVVADEAHHLRHADAARTRRFKRYFKDHPDTRFVAMSGTLTSRSVRDWGHLAELSLKSRSPVPHSWRELETWSMALGDDPNVPGACSGLTGEGALALLCEPNESTRDGFRRRINETPGVVATSETSVRCSLTIRLNSPLARPGPRALKMLETFDATQNIGGMDVDSAAHAAEVRRRLAQGFYYEWVWPGGKPDLDWVEARNAWSREVRGVIRHRGHVGLDTTARVERAYQSGQLPSTPAWTTWCSLRTRPGPDTRAVWVDYSYVDQVGYWLNGRTEQATVIWVSSPPVGKTIAARWGWAYYGENSDEEILRAKPSDHVVCSIQAHGTGKNLQAWSRSLVVWPPSAEETWEQLLGRTHRPGQLADEVLVDVILANAHAVQSWERAVDAARVQQQLRGKRLRLLYAQVVGALPSF